MPARSAATSFLDETQRLVTMCPEESRLIGYSMGARVALSMLLAAPQKFASAVLVAPNPGLQTARERAERHEVESAWCDEITSHGLEAFVDGWERKPLFDSQRSLDLQTQARQRAIRLSHFPEGIVGAIRSLGLAVMPDFWSRLRLVKLPIALVCGALDTKFCDIAKQMDAALPNSRLEILEDCGHNPVIERPEQFWTRIT